MPTLEHIADLWLRLRAAAMDGDPEAAEFLLAFNPWAAEEMKARAS